MSGSLSSVAGVAALLSSLVGWRVQLRPGSFRGVPFYLNVAPGSGGRRVAVHEFPQRDTPYLEDLGQRANIYRLNVFVVGDAYMTQRDALIKACQGSNAAGPLVHPTLGIINCRVGEMSWQEDPKSLGGYCSFDITFHRDGTQPAAATDTLSKLLAGITSMIQVGVAAYETASLISQNPANLLTFASGLLGGASGQIMGMSTAAIAGLSTLALGITAAVLNDGATATAVQNTFQQAASNVAAAQTPPDALNDAVLGNAPALAPSADLAGGLAALATWGDTLTAPAGAGAVLAALQAQQAAIVALVEGAATLAVITVYASTNFASANDAANARAQVLALVDRQSEAANLAGADDLYRAWLSLGALSMADMIARAQNLPSRVGYATGVSRSALVLAQLWYQDAARADELAALNDAMHPMFMPSSGVRLSA